MLARLRTVVKEADSEVVEEVDEGKCDSMEVRFEKRKQLRVAFVRHVGPYQECDVAWEKLTKFVTGHPSFAPDARAIGIGYDNPEVSPSDKLRYDACLPVDDLAGKQHQTLNGPQEPFNNAISLSVLCGDQAVRPPA